MAQKLSCGFLIWISIFALYWPTRTFEFINFDDPEYVYQNAQVLNGITWEGVAWAFRSEHGAHWHPLSWLSHMLDIQLFGVNSGAHHLVNAGFHATNMVLLFFLVTYLTNLFLPSLFVALFMGVHPLRIESVAWVTERKDVLSIFFILLSLVSYARYARSRSIPLYLLSWITFILSLLAKPTGVILPGLLMCLDFWPLRRFPSTRHVKPWFFLFAEKVPYLLGSLGVSIAALWAQSSGGGLKSLDAYPISDRVSSVLIGYQAYLGKLFYPSGLAIFYPFEQYQPGVGAGACVGLCAVTLIIWRMRVAHPYLIMGWSWFIIAFLPMIGIVQIGGQAFADRWTYLPHIGLVVGISWFISSIVLNSMLRRMLAMGSLAAASLITHQQLPNWATSESVFRRAIEVSPDNFMAHMNLGVALDSKGNLNEAAVEFDKAVLIRPFYPDALNNLGGARARLGDFANAEFFFQRAINTNPSFQPARFNYGLVLLDTQRPAQALFQWVLLAKANPEYPGLLNAVGNLVARAVEESCSNLFTTPQERATVASIKIEVAVLPQSRVASELQKILFCIS